MQTPQIEYCRNFIFKRHFPIHKLFEPAANSAFVLFQEGVLEVGTEDMMAVFDAVDDGGEPVAADGR
jgi:hypothetical protein